MSGIGEDETGRRPPHPDHLDVDAVAVEEDLRRMVDAVAAGDYAAAHRVLDGLAATEAHAAWGGRGVVQRWLRRAEAHREGQPLADPLSREGASDDYRGLFGVLLRSSFDGVVLSAIENRWVLEVSDSFCELVGYDRSEMVGRTSDEVGFAQPNAVRREATDRIGRGLEGIYETQLRHRDGREIWVEFSHQALGDEMVISIIRDITARREMEETLRSRTEEAEEARLAAESARADAERAWEEADHANRAKSEFLSRMSHELRTPLNAVLGFSQLLGLDDLSGGQRESVDQIVRAGRHLLNLINEVLDIARIETGEIALSSEAVHVGQLVTESLDLIRPTALQQGIALIGEPPRDAAPYVFADQHRLRQILLNLLSNAVKYNRTGGSVSVSCELVEPTRLRVKVADTGPGIRPEQIDLLFVPFERLGAERTDIEGTGIGLSLSQRLAEAMGGRLGVDTVWGSGSTFWVELPVVEGPVERLDRLTPPATEPVVAPEPAAVRHKIVQIDDNLANLKLVQRIFADRSDLEIIPAMQGRLGIELTREHQPSAVLLDLHLPDLKGEQVLQQLRDDQSTSTIPVVIVSADATPHQVQRLLSAGATAYITKPFDLNDLIATIDRVVADPEDD